MKNKLDKYKKFELTNKMLNRINGGGRWLVQKDGQVIWVNDRLAP